MLKTTTKKLDFTLKLDLTLKIIALKHAQNLRFPKGLDHGFCQKIKTFPCFVLMQNRGI